MSQALTELRFAGDRAAYRQVTEKVRALILAGDLTAGERLPSAVELAKHWGLNLRTIHLGMSPLEKEGLLTRVPRRGTFVRQREAKLTCVGFYGVAAAIEGSQFGQAVMAALKEELMQAGIELDVWLDPRSTEQQAVPWAPFVKAAEHREFQALVAGPDWSQFGWLRKLPVPAALLGTNVANRVDFDFPQMAEISLRALANQGCRSVGLIAPWATTSNQVPDAAALGGFFDKFGQVAQELGLTVKNEWMRVSPDEDAQRGRSQETFGYEQFHALWAQPERPDGLLVIPDTTVRGVIMALHGEQVRVPADLKLVLHKNEAVDLLCPMPATFVVSSERELARALVAQVQKQFRGERCEPIRLPFRLVAHRGNSQGRTNNQPERERSQL